MAGPMVADAGRRVARVLRRARAAQRRRDRTRPLLGRVLTALVCVLAGLMVMASAVNARGTDLRPGRNTDLVSLVQSQSRRNADLARRVSDVRAEVDGLSAVENPDGELQARLGRATAAAAFTPVSGPAVTVTLDDAPETVAADGVDPDLLVVHQQDIQAVVNALWSGGAEAMTIQGQRVISTTGVKCVGNTVVLHGIPYAPPYVVSAMGDPGTAAFRAGRFAAAADLSAVRGCVRPRVRGASGRARRLPGPRRLARPPARPSGRHGSGLTDRRGPQHHPPLIGSS